MNESTSSNNFNPLNPEEEWVILQKGTERPFTGKFNDHYEPGTYLCKRCDAPLYRSESKFDARCGWPSFDDEIEGAVKRVPDADGRRTEIICANCGGHLGHVFLGEGFTPKNTRHCVNSISMKFEPAAQSQKTETAIFASGCFWGTEYFLKKAEGVLSVESGYIGGTTENPSYEEVCSGKTGHAEAVRVVFNPDKVSFEELARLFFETHDPTQVNRQGPDIGTQYRSGIFYLNDEQKETAEKLISLLREKSLDVATEVTEADTFWVAEDYHQDYYEKTGGIPYCHAYRKLF
ncbi:MAG TPA: bifunctional methionine sulfoxide reductase B/A protein [Opitutales bacterium]|nr:bifunctional methionine sulfoxide reductase B/A protein [Opitutales bacterium]